MASTVSSPYPYATAPDIIRSHQKDAYFTGHLTNTLTDLHRRLLGARSTHTWGPELQTSASLLYFALTTLAGNRTLGEEYCDLVQVDGHEGGKLPALRVRGGYILGSILVPYLAGRAAPKLRGLIRRLLEGRIAALQAKGRESGREAKAWGYLLRNLQSLTSSAPVHAVTLALFYFTGTYYELTKRLLSLRYVFTRTVPDTPDRAGYEVLGILLIFQLGVQAYLHARSNFLSPSSTTDDDDLHHHQRERTGFSPAEVNVTLNHDHAYGHANSDLLLGGGGQSLPRSRVDIAAATHTPAGGNPRFSLEDRKVMAYIRGDQQRKCTLCLEELKDPSATQCGHVFCWECIGDWVSEKPECPLCRREALVQHILPLRVI